MIVFGWMARHWRRARRVWFFLTTPVEEHPAFYSNDELDQRWEGTD